MARILLADDHPQIVRLLQHCLGREGHTLLTALDGARALELIRQERPDLVILDVVMPELDGYRVLSRMRADPELRGIPVVMLTARTEPEEMTLGLDIGADCYLGKPVRPEDVVMLVRRLLEAGEENGPPLERSVA
jgi:DNA-binding response OmpR family regulator